MTQPALTESPRSWSFPREKVKLTINHANVANSVRDRDVERTLEYEVFWQIPYDETRQYVKRVTLSWEEYRRIYGSR